MKYLKITEAAIAELKQKHGELAQITLGEDTLLFSKPTRQVVSLALGKRDVIDGVEVFVENCYVGGSLEKEAVKNDVAILMSIRPLVDELIGIKVGEVKKV